MRELYQLMSDAAAAAAIQHNMQLLHATMHYAVQYVRS